MAKNILQDVVPPNRRSIRNIPISSTRKKITAQAEVFPLKKESPSFVQSKKINQVSVEEMSPVHNKRKFSKKILGLVVVLFVFLFLYIFTVFFASATITITPRQQKVTLNETIKVGDTLSGIPYEVVTLSRTEGKIVSATESKTVEERASGTVIVYNTHSNTSQRLIKNTRFETPEGLIYRIRDSITVPGQTTKSGVVTPGSVEVAIFADSPGEKYNTGLTDFTIPGFKGDPRYKAFYARSKTPMTGGFVGVRKVVATTDKEIALAELESALSDSLEKEIQTQIPDKYISYKDMIFFEFEESDQTETTDSSVKVNLKGTIKAFILDIDKLENIIASETAPALAGLGDVDFINLNNITVSVKNKSSVDILNQKPFDIMLTGEGIVVMIFPQDEIISSLLGASIDDFTVVLDTYKMAIQKADALISPFWKKTFPKDKDKIYLTKTLLEK